MQPPILPLFVGLFAVEQTADMGLIGLNLWQAHRARGVPEGLEGLADPEIAERARAHALASGLVSLFRAAASAACTLTLLLSGLLPFIDLQLDRLFGAENTSHEFVLFLGTLTAIGWLVDLPFAAWHTFGVERRFGLSAATPATFLVGRLKGWGVALALGVPFLYAVHGVMTLGGEAWWLWLFGLLAAVQVAAAWLWPTLVAPRLVPHRPLTPGALRDRLEALAVRAGLRPDAILVVDASRRGGLPNARLGGLGRPRLLLDDTLLLRLVPEEVEAVVAHELGHHLRGHLACRLLLGLAGNLALLAALAGSLAWPPLYHAFGFAGPSPHAALALVSILSGAVAFWLAPAQAWLARRQELDADAEAARLTGRPEALGAALLDLAEDRLANPWPHPWYVAWRLSHPPLLERLLALADAPAGP
jgi:STE24 endopeptidase